MKIIIFHLFFFLLSSIFALTGPKVGTKAPDISLPTTSGTNFVLSEQKKTTVLVFYRGSWCPYCINQLKELATGLWPKIRSKGVNLVGISVDQMKVAQKMKKKFKIPYTIISDPKALSLKSYNLVNTLSDELVKKYKSSYKIDVERDSGEKHHMVAHPAVIIVEKGKVIFSDVHTDYKKRTQVKAILKALGK